MRSAKIIFICLFTTLLPWSVSAFALSPSSFDFTAVRGQTLSSSITIVNTQENDQEYFLGFMGFGSKDDSGTPEFYPPDERVSELTDWILFENRSVIIPALSSSEVPFKIVVPDDTPSGGYFAAITVSPAPADIVATNGAIIEAKTASLVLLTVEGETQEHLELLDFVSNDDIFALLQRTFVYRVQNQGNVHLTPTGTVTLKGIFGQTIETLDANPVEGRVLPASTRRFDVTQDDRITGWFRIVAFQFSHLAIGPVTAVLDLSYGESGSIHSSLSFWLIPWQLLTTLLCLLIALRLLYPFFRRKRPH